MTSVGATDGRAAVWGRLVAAGLVQGEMPAAARPATPWFVRAALGVAGWIGALFLLGFVGAGLAFIKDSPAACFVVGTFACALAAVILRVGGENDFAGQFGLAVSLAGQGLLLVALQKWFGPRIGRVAAPLMLQQAVLFVAIPTPVHRVWTAWSGAYAGVLALGEWSLGPLTLPALVAGLIAAWTTALDRPHDAPVLRAAGYGLALGVLTVVTVQLFMGWIGSEFDVAPRAPAGVVQPLALTAVLLGGTLRLLRREGVPASSRVGRAALAGAAIIGAISVRAPGVGATVAILVLGHAVGDRLLAGLGITALVVYLGAFYYTLAATLLEKSALLGGAGLALLAARLVLARRGFAGREGSRA